MPLWVRTLLITAKPDEAAPVAEAHRQHLRGLAAAGKLRAAGELGDGEGFLEIFEARDRKEAEEIARSSPLVQDGLGTFMIREWTELDA